MIGTTCCTKAAISALLAAVAMVIATEVALACKCAVTSREAATASAEVVFEGRVTNIKTSGRSQVTTLSVVRAIKGATQGETITVSSRTSSATCGWDFRESASTLLVGGERAGKARLNVRRCTMYNLNQ
jgi:hypothetical protein